MTRTLTTGTVPAGSPGGPEDAYAYGIEDRRVNGVQVLGKNGGSAGFMSQLDIYPETGHVVAFLTNQDLHAHLWADPPSHQADHALPKPPNPNPGEIS